jgi:histidinol-phosphatase (PHP family)
MVAAATAKGFHTVGISDHLVLHPEIPEMNWIIPVERIGEYADEVRRIAVRAKIRVLLGAEVDFFPNNPRDAELRRIFDEIGFDYLIGSVHMLGRFPLDDQPTSWSPLSPDEIDEKHKLYWQNMRLMAESIPFDFAGHLDLTKKFGFLPTSDQRPAILKMLDSLAHHGKAVEINTGGWDKPCAEAYPAPWILRACAEREIPVVINDDAHTPDELGRHFDQAEDLLVEMGGMRHWHPATNGSAQASSMNKRPVRFR